MNWLIGSDGRCTNLHVIVFLAAGLLYMGLAVPMILRKIPPNGYYGWRTPKAFSSKKIWYEINWYCGRDFFAIGLFMFVYTVALFLLAGKHEHFDVWLVAGNLVLLVGGVILLILRGVRYLKRL